MSDVKKIPERSEIPEQYTWNTADIFPSDEAWEEEFESFKEAAKVLPTYAGRLGESAQTLYEYMELSMALGKRMGLLFNYASRKTHQDTRVGKYQAMSGKIGALAVEISSSRAFETPELLAIPDEKLERFYAEKPELELYRWNFTMMRDRREHILSDAEEKLMAAAGEMADAPSEVFSKFSNADLKFPPAVDGEGKEHPLSNGSFVPCEMSEDRVLRKSAYEVYYSTIASFRNTAAALLEGEVKQRKFYAAARK